MREPDKFVVKSLNERKVNHVVMKIMNIVKNHDFAEIPWRANRAREIDFLRVSDPKIHRGPCAACNVHCAQRRTPGDFEVSNPPEIAPVGSIY